MTDVSAGSATLGSARSALIANFLGQGWSAIMNVAFLPVYIHFLGIAAYGLVGTFTIVLSLAMLLDAAISPAINREMARFVAGRSPVQGAHDLLVSVALLCGVVLLIVSLAGVASAGWLSVHWVGKDELPPETVRLALSLMVATAVVRVSEGIFRSALIGLQRHVQANLLGAVSATAKSGGAVLALMFYSPSIEVFFIWQAVASLTAMLTFFLAAQRALPVPDRAPRVSLSALTGIKDFSSTVLVTGVLGLALSQIDKIVLVRILPLAEFGYYALAAATVNSLYMLVSPVTQSFYPRFTHYIAVKDESTLVREYHAGSQIVSSILCPAAVVLIFFSTELLSLWTGNPYLAGKSGPLLAFLAVGTMLHGLMFLPYMLQLASDWPALSMRINAVAALVLVPALLIIVPRHGVVGAAAIWACLTAGYVIVGIQLMHRRLLRGQAASWYFWDVGAPSLAALAVVGSGAMLKRLVDGPAQMFLLIAVVAGLGFGAAVLSTAGGRRWTASAFTAIRHRH